MTTPNRPSALYRLAGYALSTLLVLGALAAAAGQAAAMLA